MRVPKVIEAALEATGLPWSIEKGSRHQKIKVSGQLVGVLPINVKSEGRDRACRNVVAQIRRAGK